MYVYVLSYINAYTCVCVRKYIPVTSSFVVYAPARVNHSKYDRVCLYVKTNVSKSRRMDGWIYICVSVYLCTRECQCIFIMFLMCVKCVVRCVLYNKHKSVTLPAFFLHLVFSLSVTLTLLFSPRSGL